MTKKMTKKTAKKVTVKKTAKKVARKQSAKARYARVFAMSFASIYPLYVAKAEKKGRTKKEVDQIIEWLTGYTPPQLKSVISKKVDFETFFAQAPRINPNTDLIRGVVCGIRVEDVEDPMMQKIRYLDKLVDELARGKKLESILRS